MANQAVGFERRLLDDQIIFLDLCPAAEWPSFRLSGGPLFDRHFFWLTTHVVLFSFDKWPSFRLTKTDGLNDAKARPEVVSGVAIYPYWEMDETEWEVYSSLWLGAE